MSDRAPLSFGIKTSPQHTTYDAMLHVWQEADAEPIFEHAWLFDHFAPLSGDQLGPCLEGWTLLAAFAAQTQRLRVGIMVTGNTYRHPAVLANMGATVDIIANGRLDFGIGAGWNEFEHTSYGIPLYPAGERLRRFGEACEVIKRLWTEETVDFDGQYYQLKGAHCEPKPIQKPYPPFVIGGSGEKLTLRIVAQYAAVWNFAGGPVEEFVRLNGVLDGHCAAVERDPATIQRSVQLPVNPAQLEETRDLARSFIEAGANHVILNLGSPRLQPPAAGSAPYPEGIIHRLAEEVATPLRAEFQSH